MRVGSVEGGECGGRVVVLPRAPSFFVYTYVHELHL